MYVYLLSDPLENVVIIQNVHVRHPGSDHSTFHPDDDSPDGPLVLGSVNQDGTFSLSKIKKMN